MTARAYQSTEAAQALALPPPTARDRQKAALVPLIEGAIFLKHFYEGETKLLAFLVENGRLPFITDEVKPWEYPGWMIPYIFLLEAGQQCPARYHYLVETLRAERLLDEPIPRIDYDSNIWLSPVYKSADKLCDQLGHTHGFGERALIILMDWLAWSLGLETERPKYITPETNEFLYRNFKLDEWVVHAADYLGALLTEYRSHSARKSTAFFVTPMNLVELMVRMNLPEGEDYRAKKILEPAVGSGRFLMVAGNYSMRLFGVDIDPVCVKATRINMALYVPWTAWPIPEGFWAQYDQASAAADPRTRYRSIIRENFLRMRPPEGAKTEAPEKFTLTAPALERRPTRSKSQTKAPKQHSIHEAQGSLFETTNEGRD